MQVLRCDGGNFRAKILISYQKDKQNTDQFGCHVSPMRRLKEVVNKIILITWVGVFQKSCRHTY